MKKFKRKTALALTLFSVLSMSPVRANAEWRNNSTGWWYAEGNSWATGWKQIDGKWYYFNSNGYMEHNTTIEGYQLGSDGSMIENSYGKYYIGKDLVPTKVDSFSGNGYCSYSNKYKGSNDRIVDNFNKTYNNYIKLTCWDGGDTSQFGRGVQYVYVEIPLQSQFKEFKSSVGICQYSKDYLKSADVKVYLDGEEVYSKNFTSGDKLADIDLNITGKSVMKLAVENIEGNSSMGNAQEFGFFNPEFIK